jgi:drug/metabolite transporter (DMT)-like permease
LAQDTGFTLNALESTAVVSRSDALSPHRGRLLADLALLGAALIWGSAFAAQRVAAAQVGPFLYNGVRFLLRALLQMLGQKGAPAIAAVLVLSLEGVFAALFGWWFLGELLSPRQLVGCGSILGGMLMAQLCPGKNRERPRSQLEGQR